MARYIDADELIQEVERVIESTDKKLDVNPYAKELYLLGMKHTLDFVRITPSVEIKQGD